MTTTPHPFFFNSLLQALDYYGDRELCFQHRTLGSWALADNRDGELIDALTSAGGVLVFGADRELRYERELQELYLRQEEEDRFRYLDGDHHEERGEILPEHYHPDNL